MPYGPTSKQVAEMAPRITVRYLVAPNCYQAVVVYNTALATNADMLATQWVKRLKAEGKKGVQKHKWTPVLPS